MRPLVVTAPVVLALLLVACSNDPEPIFADPTPTPPSSSSPAIAPTTDPVETSPTQEPDPLTPEETVEAWVDAHNQFVADGDDTAVLALSTDDCTTCEQLAAPFAKIYADGGAVVTDGWSVESVAPRPDFSSKRGVVAAIDFARGTSQADATSEPTPFPSDQNILEFTLARQSGSWAVAQIAFLS